ncbi:FAD-dependent monooxygenase [Streptomyces thioluteus]|uniref:FAD-dependent monooxygenase n=1 Tax=Streptomyces thioluteus TaxID=66431 RepID=UPI0031E691A3
MERLPEPSGQSRGLGFTARAMEVLDSAGVLPCRRGVGDQPGGHFGGLRFDYSVLPGAHFGARGIPQARTEAVLEEWAGGLGADIRRGWELTGPDDLGDAVQATVHTPGGVPAAALRVSGGLRRRAEPRCARRPDSTSPGPPRPARCTWADVGRLRGAAAVPRRTACRRHGDGRTAARRGGPRHRLPGPRPGARARRAARLAEVAAAWRRITGEDIGGGPRGVGQPLHRRHPPGHTSTRRGRILLAGDAATSISPQEDRD